MEFRCISRYKAVVDLQAHIISRFYDRSRVRGEVVDLRAGEGEVVGLDFGGVEGGGEVGDEVGAVGGGTPADGVAEGEVGGGEGVLEPVEAGGGVGGAEDEEFLDFVPAGPSSNG